MDKLEQLQSDLYWLKSKLEFLIQQISRWMMEMEE